MIKRIFAAIASSLLLSISLCAIGASETSRFDYQLRAIEIADGTFVVPGTTEDFSMTNGGNIVNTTFVITKVGVVVIDTGPSVRYAQQFNALLHDITEQPVVAAIITHHHPDHWFGNQFYPDTPIYALPATIDAMKLEGDNFADNIYRMSGDWMRSTEPMPATKNITPELLNAGLTIGDHTFELTALEGHTVADLAVRDTNTGVLFAGDLAFDQRAPTTPHANLAHWQQSLNALGDMDYTQLVPGHGPVANDDRAIQFTRHYLTWLEELLIQSARSGANPTEVMQAQLPAAFSDASLMREELARSVVHLYGRYEDATLQVVKTGGYN